LLNCYRLHPVAFRLNDPSRDELITGHNLVR
jgi:hypothetical protein